MGAEFWRSVCFKVENGESESFTVGPIKRMRSPGSNDTNTYNLYICLFTGIFLDNCVSLTKIRAENQVKLDFKKMALGQLYLVKVQRVEGDMELMTDQL